MYIDTDEIKFILYQIKLNVNLLFRSVTYVTLHKHVCFHYSFGVSFSLRFDSSSYDHTVSGLFSPLVQKQTRHINSVYIYLFILLSDTSETSPEVSHVFRGITHSFFAEDRDHLYSVFGRCSGFESQTGDRLS
jgi:hypothetical protein